uniref:Uncharacterized protein n=1 Tax=Arundo donax TaxID=35708 RepID=A0A0A9HQ76_ARUDO
MDWSLVLSTIVLWSICMEGQDFLMMQCNLYATLYLESPDLKFGQQCLGHARCTRISVLEWRWLSD